MKDIKKNSASIKKDKKIEEKYMEVHHPHHNHPGKKWKNYLYEFFMLFLAVTAGFIVENIREDYIERHREYEYIKSLVEDIKVDTTEIRKILDICKDQILGMDSLLIIMEKPKKQDLTNDLYYYSINYINTAGFFKHSDRTIVQLKNSGALRLIQRAGVSDSIISYYSSVANAEYNSDFHFKQFEKLITFQKEMFDLKIIRYHSNELASLPGLKLYDTNPRRIDHYYNEIYFYSASIQNYIALLKELNIKAVSLMKFLEYEYDLK